MPVASLLCAVKRFSFTAAVPAWFTKLPRPKLPKPKDGGKISLNFLLIIPFVVQIVAAVGVTAYVSLRSGEKTVADMVNQLQTETGNRVEAYVRSYTNLPHQFLRSTRASIDAGILDPNDFQAWKRYLWYQAPLNESAQLIYFANLTNEFIGIERPVDDGDWEGGGPPSRSPQATLPGILWTQSATTDNQLRRTQLDDPAGPGELIQTINNFRPTERPWFEQAERIAGPSWSPIYKDLLRPRLVISAMHPLYGPAKETGDDRGTRDLLGVLAIDFNLTELSKFLGQLNLSDRGEAFIVERSAKQPGNLVASSDANQSAFIQEGTTQRRFNGFDSDNQAIQWSLVRLQQEFGSLMDLPTLDKPLTLTIDLGRDRLFVYVNSLKNAQGLDWLLVVAEYESDFTQTLKLNTRNTMLMAAIGLMVATIVSILTARLIARPILDLSEASKAISDGALDQSVKSSSSVTELEALAHSFNQMSSRMKDAFAELEIRVQLRTFELWEAKEDADRAKESATAANRSKSEFLANMSHELRTPLNGILGYAQILQKDTSLQPRQHKAINTIAQCGNHLLSLINDVLDLAKIEARRMDIEPSAFSLEKLLSSVVEIFHIRTLQKGLTFKAELDKTLPDGVISDPKRLRQVLINLLGNAVKFTETGQVTLSVTVLPPSADQNPEPLTLEGADPQSAQTLRFTVEDTGVGMDPKTLAKVFIPFEQGGGIAQRSQGTGLGLSISQQIVELLGSRIHVTSRLDQGSKFWFDLTLLASPVESAHDGSSHWENILGYQENPVRILIVDYRLENRAILTELLEPVGFLIQEASQLDAVMELVQDDRPDLIILDMDWPDRDDVYDDLSKLSHSPEFAGIPLLVSSASVFERDRLLSLEAGANDFLTKPIQVAQLYEKLTQHLQLHWIYNHDAQTSSTPSQPPSGSSASASPDSAVPSPIESSASAPTDAAPPIVPPSAEDLDTLFRLAMQGNISQIKHHATQLAEQDETLQPFATEISRLAGRFLMKDIRALIGQYRS